MRSNTETGHANNAANFNKLISYVRLMGSLYQPSPEALQIPALEALSEAAQQRLQALMEANLRLDDAVIARKMAYAGVKVLSTRMINLMISLGIETAKTDDARAFQRKLGAWAAPKGRRKKGASADEPAAPKRFVSQQSFDSKAALFAQLVALVAAEPRWQAVQGNLSAQALQEKSAALYKANQRVVQAALRRLTAISARNAVFYDPMQGLLQSVRQIKAYLLSLGGRQSPHYRALSGLKFKPPR